MEKQKKKAYEAPDLTAVTFKMERGYALSMVAGVWDRNPNNDAEGAGVSDYNVESNGDAYWNW